MEGVIIETKYKCSWCHSVYDSFDKANKCYKRHKELFSKVHPIQNGTKVIFRNLNLSCNVFQVGIIVKTNGKDWDELIYLVEREDDERYWRRWFDVCKSEGKEANYQNWLDGIKLSKEIN